MASNQTTNYGLNQWEATDQVLRTDFNADNSKIDAALKGLADKDMALDGALGEQATALTMKGNCQIELKTYIGTGTYGQGNQNSITFSTKPTAMLLVGDRTLAIFRYGTSIATGISTDGTPMSIAQSWSGNTVRFYGSRADLQMNSNGKTYWALAFCEMDKV